MVYLPEYTDMMRSRTVINRKNVPCPINHGKSNCMLYVKDKNFISKENTVVTFGKFDGIHNGHRLLIEKAVRIGHEQGIKVVLCTFNMDNWNAKPQKVITTPDERAYICENMA